MLQPWLPLFYMCVRDTTIMLITDLKLANTVALCVSLSWACVCRTPLLF